MSFCLAKRHASTFGVRLAHRATQARFYASAPTGSSSNVPLILAAAGAAGLGAYVYLDRKPGEGKLGHASPGAGPAVSSEKSSTGAEGFALDKDTWKPFLLTEVTPYNHNTKLYHFSFGEEGRRQSRGGEVAHALLVRSPEGEAQIVDEKGKPVIRPYTPVSPSSEQGGLTLMIKEYQDGKLTSHISSMTPGKDSLLFKGPIPKYKYQPNTFDRGLCISGGSGITPMFQLISHSLKIAEDKTKWTLIFANVTEKDILLRREWDELAKAHPERLEVNYVLDNPPKGWKGESGFVDQRMIRKLFDKKDGKVMAFVCGPPGQVKAVAGPKDGPRQGELLGALKDLEYTPEEVYKF